ncbi:cytochrome P450, cyclodipeptide synthase-associated [Verminephrobacter aporrectodeae]|uniref:cytochrome P450, cyclodipeptide synthase-associated n=1 Tax=Verminephrobacter aporrectodeae TaxID=1110389 RepID=UPI00224388EC|nr:cytochrome P450, cyclodipeptide synthase-associated [Verminephrobacter aporrectodeae]MCW8175242.1 cytochrome P450, cyclodipeptide synthase-associated [Verminephrobacter aporrectodeae subsp. tuberculatae]MCW8202657.1 cytochrome P450, cyclodipeptide synthase-associated [Verminephrobacter aporrectodeae subsp. tuberculatae]
MSTVAFFDALDSSFQRDPYAYYDQLHSNDLIYVDRSTGAYFIGKYDDVKKILYNMSFTTEPLADRAQPVMRGRVLAQMEGDEHRSKKNTILKGLRGNYFHNVYSPLICKITKHLLDPYLPSGRIDLVQDFGKDYAILVTLGILGLPTENYQQIAQWHTGVADFITRLDLSNSERLHSLECSRLLSEFLRPIIATRMEDPGDDFISLMCYNNDGHPAMAISEIIALCLNILLAATEPADKSLALLFKHLLDHPDVFAKVYRDRSLLRSAIEESLRLTSPVQLIPRKAKEDVNISGVFIPKGALIFNMIGAANRDPHIFRNPGEFNIHRHLTDPLGSDGRRRRHLAFGSGRHVCLGAEFSLRQIEITTSILLDRLIELRIANGFEFEECGFYIRGPRSLLLEFTPSIR